MKKRKKAAADAEAAPLAEAIEGLPAPERKLKKKKRKAPIADDVADAQPVKASGDGEAAPKKKKKKKLKTAIPAEEAVKKKKRKGPTEEEEEDSEGEEEKTDKKTEKLDLFKKKDPAAPCAHKVCIVGLPWHVTEELLRQDFEECGDIEVMVLLTAMHEGKPRSRGIAFISYASSEGMAAALKYNGTEYGGRYIKVNPALEREDRNTFQEGKGKDGKGKGKGKDGKGKDKGKGKGKPRAPLGEKPEHCTSILVKSLAPEVVEDDLRTFFQSCGAAGATNIRILTSAASKGLAFVDFDDTDAVDQAVKLNGSDLKGSAAHLDYSKPRAHKIRKTAEPHPDAW